MADIKSCPTNSISLRIILVAPPAGVDFGLQEGSGNEYETIQIQRSSGGDLTFLADVEIKDNRADGLPNFLGKLTQGPPNGRFIYIDIGTLAGQADTPWERRIKVPLSGITWDMIQKVEEKPTMILEARLPGTARDGGPACATVQPIGGWSLAKRK